jgi:hypothetical protein
MQPHASHAYRWITAHRRELALATGLLLALVTLVLAVPVLLLVAAVESRHGSRRRRKRRLNSLVALSTPVGVIGWLWCELNELPHGRWHPCVQCGQPIQEPSRAAFCSHACRTYARLERDALDNDPRIAARATRRLRHQRFRDLADNDPRLTEVPF